VPSRDRFQLPAAALLAAAAAAAWWRADFFAMELLAEIAVLAIFTMSLQFLVGLPGMVSLGHAGFLAAGAYSTAAATLLLGWPPAAALALSVAVAAVLAAAVGWFVIRLSGVFFIMITLAVGQMFHAYFFRARLFGGDNGMAGTPRIDLTAFGLDSGDSGTFALLVLACAVLVYLLLLLLTRSPFGMMLGAIGHNESRLAALGCPIRRYKLAAFAAAGAVAGLAGGLTAQHTGFISPDLAFWTLSGEALIIVILGGSGSLAGAAAGAALFVLLRDLLSSSSFWTGLSLSPQLASHWQLLMGLLFIVVVLAARDGLYGRLVWLIEGLARRVARRRMPS
jgi:branched-chain amino acid transport system permease protein